ncbi:CocE/NonD family hydrolase [Streptomyces justiciae]|uniref:CocE/NonD family hydrolase n=1 Tax=Streptomyces justiciae TaxID=2780140 RepID=UPI0021187805|nr:CocE/NonD family hydrolase [Streptomyces justiciae]MCW8379721.1 CocE/NonD family hydrolase [Streptomyces justiciae]
MTDRTADIPAAYPSEWHVIYEDPTPLKDSPVAPDDGASDGHGVDGFFGAARWSRYTGFNPATFTYKKGETLYSGGPAFQSDITFEQDVEVVLRDGKKLYVDVFRPTGATEPLPAIVVYGPYGKSVPTNPRWVFPGPLGESMVGAISGLTRFEGPDPDFWAANGYVVVSADPRGVNSSEGDIHAWGRVQAGDTYDVIEWAAEQDWSNGKVGLSGVSWLGLQQWYAAALQPPHLAAIAPWGAHQHDIYRQDVLTGGIPGYGFNEMIMKSLSGGNKVEAVYAMAEKYPLWNAYWEDKAADLEKVEVPVYSVGNLGFLGVDSDGYRGAASHDKWLVIQHDNQWHDMYAPERVDELRRFFDKYLKGLDNGWEETPKVRVPVVDVLKGMMGNIEEKREAYVREGDAWPLPGTRYTKYYLDADTGTLSTDLPNPSSLSYDAETETKTFTLTFDQETELTGYLSLRLHVEADGADDADVFVSVEKLGTDDSVLYMAALGRQRVSLRALDPEKSEPYLPVHSFVRNEPLSPGEIVPVDIAINPTAILFHPGEKLRVTVGGNALAFLVTPSNSGRHVLHTGAGHDSHVLVPVITEG